MKDFWPQAKARDNCPAGLGHTDRPLPHREVWAQLGPGVSDWRQKDASWRGARGEETAFFSKPHLGALCKLSRGRKCANFESRRQKAFVLPSGPRICARAHMCFIQTRPDISRPLALAEQIWLVPRARFFGSQVFLRGVCKKARY